MGLCTMHVTIAPVPTSNHCPWWTSSLSLSLWTSTTSKGQIMTLIELSTHTIVFQLILAAGWMLLCSLLSRMDEWTSTAIIGCTHSLSLMSNLIGSNCMLYASWGQKYNYVPSIIFALRMVGFPQMLRNVPLLIDDTESALISTDNSTISPHVIVDVFIADLLWLNW